MNDQAAAWHKLFQVCVLLSEQPTNKQLGSRFIIQQHKTEPGNIKDLSGALGCHRGYDAAGDEQPGQQL